MTTVSNRTSNNSYNTTSTTTNSLNKTQQRRLDSLKEKVEKGSTTYNTKDKSEFCSIDFSQVFDKLFSEKDEITAKEFIMEAYSTIGKVEFSDWWDGDYSFWDWGSYKIDNDDCSAMFDLVDACCGDGSNTITKNEYDNAMLLFADDDGNLSQLSALEKCSEYSTKSGEKEFEQKFQKFDFDGVSVPHRHVGSSYSG